MSALFDELKDNDNQKEFFGKAITILGRNTNFLTNPELFMRVNLE